ncbi:hypothetical protein [Actinomadura sp. WMMA1423]|uniref:hypothetical protein n=1 Tax=Actinomadura sp. WMMA1423 TaxID=2591108 RepID=UPI001146AE70|nr:hypothetical protein [Actinomadura sp. WMMA1423]
MAIERVRRVGTYAPLAANYFMDDAIAEAGEAAELLFIRGLAFCASRPEQDGYLSRTQLVRFVGVGMSDAVERARRLVDVELWEAVDDGYQVRSWLKWNRSADEIGRYRAKDRERKRKATEGVSEGAADSDTTSARNPSGVRAEGVAESKTASDTQMHYTSDAVQEVPPSSTSMETCMEHSTSTSKRPTPGSDDDPQWCRFWDAYPRKDGKKVARTRWATAVKKTDPEVIITGAERYRDRMAREGTPRQKIKMPEGWLNGERWEDESGPHLRAVGGWLDN